MTADSRVPGYLGRVRGGDGPAVGTCFQVAPEGVLVTAWHVLDGLGAGDAGAVVAVDDLGGGQPALPARVIRVDPLHDLAVLVRDEPLPATVAGLWLTDAVAPLTDVVVAGVSRVDDPGHEYAWMTGTGSWKGGTTRDDQVPLGRLSSPDVLPGMSGSPVRRLSDDGVAGVVSGRYNASDNWLRDSVWVARIEDLLPLLSGLELPAVHGRHSAGESLELTLEVDRERTRLTGASLAIAGEHGGHSFALAEAVDRLRRARSLLVGLRTKDAVAAAPAESTAAGQVGRLLARTYLPAEIADELAGALAVARSRHVPLSVGLRLSGEVADLPWETLWLDGAARPLALDELVRLYRKVEAPPVRLTGGPLRILVAISSPVAGGSGVLDYEQELRSVLKAVRGARAGDAEVRIVHFATTAAIRGALRDWPAHVLHLSGHGGPGVLELEDDDGNARPVNADTFIAEAVPPGLMPAVISLAGCYTNAATATGDPSFAARLLASGAHVVIAAQTSITDVYATRVFARLYAQLAVTRDCDVVAAVAEARVAVQRELEQSADPRDQRLAGLDEWSVLSVLSSSASAPIVDPSAPARPSSAPAVTSGVLRRETGEVVGRRWEQRRYPAELMSTGIAGMVLHGLGGVGKTTLADELIARLQESAPALVVAIIEKRSSADELLDTILDAFADQLFEPPAPSWATEPVLRGLRRAHDGDLPWRKRLAALIRWVLPAVPTLVVLDNFEDNLTPSAHHLVDDEVAALLATLTATPGQCRLLITSRYRFTLPGGAERALAFKPVRPLSHAETLKLAWALPHLDRLADDTLEHLWRTVGGHPRCLEYVDALLARGQARFADVRLRLTDNVLKRLRQLGRPSTDIDNYLGEHDRLDAALAEAAALASDDVLLDDLLAGLAPIPAALDLLRGASVYRVPVDRNALVYQLGEPDPEAGNEEQWRATRARVREILAAAGAEGQPIDTLPEAVWNELAPHLAVRPTPPIRVDANLEQALLACASSSLLTVLAGNTGIVMHRWTAGELLHREIDAGRSAGVIAAHRRAAEYWKWRVGNWPQPPAANATDLREAHHHLEQAMQLGDSSATRHLATTSYELDTLLDRLGRRTEALAFSQQAADLQRLIAREDQPKTLRDLGGFLSNLGNRLAVLGQRVEALDPAAEAVDIYRRLAAANPAVFEPDLAMALNNFGSQLADLGRSEEALAATAEAVDIRRRLAAANPAAYQPGLASALTNHGGNLADLGRSEEALTATAEAVDIYRQLTAVNPATFQSDFASALTNHGGDLADQGRPEEAFAATVEAVDIYRRLAAANPAAFQPNLTMALINLGSHLMELGRPEEAVAATAEAVDIRRLLAAANPAAFEPDLATALYNLGSHLVSLGRLVEALTLISEAVDIYRQVLSRSPHQSAQRLHAMLLGQAQVLDALDRNAEASAVREEIAGL